MTAAVNQPSRTHRLKHGFLHLAIVTLYLYVCFSAIIVYKAAVLQAYDIDFAPWGLAFVKALVIAKFFEIGELLNLKKRLSGLPLAWYLVCEVVLFAALIVALSFLEEGDAVPEEVTMVIRDPQVTEDTLTYKVEVLDGTLPAKAGPCSLFIDPFGRPLSPVSAAGMHRRDRRRDRRRF